MPLDDPKCQCFRRGDISTDSNTPTWHLWWRRSHYPLTFADLEQESLREALRLSKQALAVLEQLSEQPERMGSVSWTTVTELCALHRDQNSPFAVTRGLTDAEARSLATRSVFVHAVYRLWCSGASHAQCAEQLEHLCKQGALKEALPKQSSSFRIEQVTYGRRLSMATQQMNLDVYRSMLQYWTEVQQRSIRLSDDEAERVVLLEDHQIPVDSGARVHVARWLADGGCQHPIYVYRLKIRPFIGTTSMDAELSFVMANVARVGPGQVVLDPYVGTGSILVACAVAGASQLFGSDLDRWVLYGTSHTARSRHRTQALDRKTCAEPETTKTRISEHASVGTVPRQLPRITNPATSTGKPDWPSTRDGATTRLSMLDNFRFYGIPRHQWPELVRMDLLEPAWASNAATGERSGWCDAIVCDPPYGIREGTRQARIRSSKQVDTRQGQRKRAPFAAHLEALFRLAARVLRPGGRLVLWLPAVAELTAYDLPRHEALVYFGTPCCQRMRGGLRRYLLVLVKKASANALPDPNVQNEVFYKEAPPRYQRAHENLAARLFGVAERDEQHLRPRSFCQR
ncbi:hypothetical protein CCYA_CCYA04G1419 [Cyanidiococcus yangmingshanensis]|nr:hypothetical protein CCYA_CCYA04G1419 [Cyanidiococcus yangmingshanensis]